MILKGNARSNGSDLATHLMNEEDEGEDDRNPRKSWKQRAKEKERTQDKTRGKGYGYAMSAMINHHGGDRFDRRNDGNLGSGRVILSRDSCACLCR